MGKNINKPITIMIVIDKIGFPPMVNPKLYLKRSNEASNNKEPMSKHWRQTRNG